MIEDIIIVRRGGRTVAYRASGWLSVLTCMAALLLLLFLAAAPLFLLVAALPEQRSLIGLIWWLGCLALLALDGRGRINWLEPALVWLIGLMGRTVSYEDRPGDPDVL